MKNDSNDNHTRMEQHHQQKQKTFDFDTVEPSREPAQVARDTSLPPPLVRPDRQIVYNDPNPYAWPDPEPLCDHDTITVDRVQSGMDGPAHRFIIKRDDYVEAWFGKDRFEAGTVVGISHARKEVKVRFTEGSEGQWFSVGAIYPAPEPEGTPADNEVPLTTVIDTANDKHAPKGGFTDADRVLRPVSPEQILAHLTETPGHEFTALELRQYFGHTDFDPARPLDNAVHVALTNLRDRGLIHVREPRFGQPTFSVLNLPASASELTRSHCPETLAGSEIRRLLREHGWTIRAFARRWGFTQKHIREVFERGLGDQDSVHDWIEAALTPPPPASKPEPPKQPAADSRYADTTAYTFDEFKELLKHRGRHESFEKYQSDFERLLTSRDAVIAELLTRYKAPQLKNVAGNLGEWHARSNTKQENAESVYRKMLGYFVLDGVVSFGMNEKYQDAVAKKVRAVTKDDWHAHFEQAAEQQKEREQALADPQNLADFAAFIRAKGQDALTNEQLACWDAMHADLARERRAANGPVRTVSQFESTELQTVEFTVKEGYHEKRRCPLWIVQLGDRVERDTYKELLEKAKQLGGWYSSFKKSDAGFQFLSEDAATSFTGLLSGNADRSDILTARKERKEQTTSERLHELAAEMLSRSEETIEQSHQSLQNTARRADMQAGVRGRAYAEAALGRTLHSVADALSRGEAKYLDGIRHRTHIEELDRVLHLAKWARIRAIRKAKDESEYGYGLRVDDEEARPYSNDDIRFAQYPYPSVYARNLKELVVRCQRKRGLKQLSAKLLKRLPRNPEQSDFVRFNHDYEIGLLSDFVSRAKASGVDAGRVADELIHFERLQRARIGDIHELRAALREYLPHKASARGDDPVLVAERELIGRDLPGFFPTPLAIIQQMLELADIEEGQTVLEPSCGKGDIVTEIRREHPQVQLTAIEKNYTLAEVLAAKGIEAVFEDFLLHHGTYDRIVMNPPFEKGQDAQHVMHAYSLLAPGGRLVSVMGEGVFGRSDAASTGFQRWLGSLGAETSKLPEDAFKGADSFRQTGVRTRLVVIDKGD
jgi:hypothetical protein